MRLLNISTSTIPRDIESIICSDGPTQTMLD
jgi:hypothetical protein